MSQDQMEPQKRRKRVILEQEEFLPWCLEHWVTCAEQAIYARGRFLVALSGGKTPEQLYRLLATPEWKKRVDWKRVWLLWSDERAVLSDDPASNYRMAMDAGMGQLGIPQEQIFRMQAEEEVILHARKYSERMRELLQRGKIDLVMLGMGDDGHIASLFPGTEALLERQELAVANFVPKLSSWRMTMTYPAFREAYLAVLYVTGENKAEAVQGIWEKNAELPAQKVGTLEAPALWVLDKTAASKLRVEK